MKLTEPIRNKIGYIILGMANPILNEMFANCSHVSKTYYLALLRWSDH